MLGYDSKAYRRCAAGLKRGGRIVGRLLTVCALKDAAHLTGAPQRRLVRAPTIPVKP